MENFDIYKNIVESFEETILSSIVKDKVGVVGLKREEEFKGGKKIDIRVPKFMSISGKGSPNHKEYSNVTLFDHSLSVALASLKLYLYTSKEVSLRTASIIFITGVFHDCDKLLKKSYKDIRLCDIENLFTVYNINAYLDILEIKNFKAKDLFIFIQTVETRTSNEILEFDTEDENKNILTDILEYVRLSDELDSLFLKDDPEKSLREVAKRFESYMTSIPDNNFEKLRFLHIYEPHHPFLLDLFFDILEEKITTISGMEPLFHINCDQNIFTLIPESSFEEVIKQSSQAFIEENYIPFDLEFIFTSKGTPKIVGDKPNYHEIKEKIESKLKTGDYRRLLEVDLSDLRNHEEYIREICRKSNIPISFDLDNNMGVRVKLPLLSGLEELNTENLLSAYLISFALSVEENTKNKNLKKENRMTQLRNLILFDIPDFFKDLNQCTQCAILSILLVNSNYLKETLEETLPIWFNENGVFSDMENKSFYVKKNVAKRFFDICMNNTIEDEGENYCLITGERTKLDAISSSDGLLGIKTSAMSYRDCRPEYKFAEKSGTYLSPSSYAEYKIRKNIYLKSKMRIKEDCIPIKITTRKVSGIFSPNVTSIDFEKNEFSISDLNSTTRHENHFEENLYMRKRTVGKFISVPNRFSDFNGLGSGSVSFVRMILEATLRFGQPIHLFAGLPSFKKSYFYSDCLDPAIYKLIGNDLRIEEIPEAIEKLKILEFLGSSKSSGGLSEAAYAKDFCYGKKNLLKITSYLWSRVRENDNIPISLEKKLSNIIEEEVKKMESNKENISPVVVLGRMAKSIQRLDFNGSNTEQQFLFKIAIEAVSSSSKKDLDAYSLTAYVAAQITINADRRQKTKGFFSGSQNREEGKNISDCIFDFSSYFVNELWIKSYKKHIPNSKTLSEDLATYQWVFTKDKKYIKPEENNSTEKEESNA
jgi:hypothetical protein